MIRRVLKNKLVSLGYSAGFVEQKIRELVVSVDASRYTESELQERVEVYTFDEPNAEIPRFYLNISHEFVDRFVFDGKVDSFAKFSVVGSQILICDYSLSDKLCIIGITPDVKIYILCYTPSREATYRFAGKTYEEIFGEERENEANEYFKALTAGGRVPNLKAKDILYSLMSEYVIDMILINNLNPPLKLYDNAQKFAEIITSYRYKYINRRINRIEFVEKNIEVRYKGSGVKLGFISNDPYLRLSEVNQNPDFSLSKPTYVWYVNDANQEALAIYTASERYNKTTYRELLEFKEDPALTTEIDKLTVKFSTEAGYAISKQYVASVLKRLNKELIVLPQDFIRRHTQESFEYIEPLRYKFSVMKNRREFENLLYNAIENNLNGRYKFRYVEKLSGIYLVIGNKLNYTDISGNLIRKQSIADFNINYNAAIIKRETIIDSRSIPQLMGYIYKDMDDAGTDMLPVPSVEVVFYFPELASLGRDVEMYNGTPVELSTGDGETSFSEIGVTQISGVTLSLPRDPNEKYVIVRFINSDGETLKENVVRDVVVGSVYSPEIIPIISDRKGRDWITDSSHIPSVLVTNDNSQNVVEVHYIKKVSRVRINYINKQGKEIGPPVIKNMQVGETFDMEEAKKFTDATGVEWNLYQSNPTRLTISEVEATNVITLIYDVIKSDVFVSYKTRSGLELKPQDKFSVVSNIEFVAETPQEIVGTDGLVWEFGNDSKSVITVSETDLNLIELFYDEKKSRVITTFINEDGVKIKDDVVDLVQVGKQFTPRFEQDFTDIYGKKWKLITVDRPQFQVANEEDKNICVVSYGKVLSTIIVSMLNAQGGRIKDDIMESAQIGTSYTPDTIAEIEDVNGLVWTCVDKKKSLQVSESEIQNRITYQYEPLITTVTFQYVDDEGRELIPSKQTNLQAGSFATPEFISNLTSDDQRGWVLSQNNERSFRVNKHKEENIFKINYDKKMVDIYLEFKDIHGMTLKQGIQDQAQIGSEYNPRLYEKITADNGERLMITKTEPSTMFVRENSRFTLIYDEIKARVTVKCINIADDTSIVNDTMITTKLGGVFVPNIQQKIFDKKKLRWNYVGEPAMSIVAKENDQENIIKLKYEPDMIKVTLRYENNFGQLVHEDVVKEEQIGNVIGINEYDKMIEENGMGWKLQKMSRHSLEVDEDEDKNIVTSYYVPLMADVTTRYIDNDGTELTNSKVESVQVGETFNANILDRVPDKLGKIWEYSKINVEPIKIVDDVNKVNIKYVPLMSSVTNSYCDTDQNKLIEDNIEEIQVGTLYSAKQKQRVIDEEGKYWIFRKVSRDSLKVSDEPSNNNIIYTYDKELIEVVVKFKTNQGDTLLNDKNYKLQIGSKFNITPENTLYDSKKLGWKVSESNELDVVISPEKENNIFTVIYDEYMVNVYDKFLHNETGEELIDAAVSLHQVGSSYLVKVQETIIDASGKHWLQAAGSENSIFVSKYKVDPITISTDETKNVTVVKYKPKLANTLVKYVNNVGNEIKPEETVKVQIGSVFSEEIPLKIVDSLGNKWAYNPKTKADVVISEDPSQNKVILSYEEAQGIITFKYLDATGEEIQKPTTQLAQIGSHFTPQCEMIITDANECVWEFSEKDRESFEVSEEDEENIVVLTYVPLNIDVKINYIDLWDNEIVEPKMLKAQLGSVYKPHISQDFTNDEGLLYRFKSIYPDELKIKDLPMGSTKTPNIFSAKFEPINSDVIIRCVDMDGNLLRDEEKVHLQVGSKYTPEPAQFIKDKKGNEWELENAKKDEITVFENPDENVLTYSYDVAKADVILRFINVDGIVIKDEQHIPKQVGEDFVPAPDEVVFDRDNKKWKLIDVKPVNLVVGSINNIITVTYQEDKVKVSIKYVDEEGNILKATESQEAQIGAKFAPKVSNKVIYNANEIWRYQKTEPYEIIISENETENEVKLIFSNAVVKNEEEEKSKELVNPFANTISEEEKEILRRSEKSNVFDATNEDTLSANEGMVKFDINDEEPSETEEEGEFEFSDPYLKSLAKAMKLSNEEKIAINTLNDLNTEIDDEIRKAGEVFRTGGSYDFSNAEKLTVKEKELIKESLQKIIAKDKTGANLLKIFESITASETGDRIIGRLQQKKAIILTDYFIDKTVDDIEKARYILERGKNLKAIEIIERKIANGTFKKDPEPAYAVKTALYFEKLLLENYYKERTLSADNYFTDPNARPSFSSEIVDNVSGLLVKQASQLLLRDNISFEQRNEIEALYLIASSTEKDSIKDKINNANDKDNRVKKNALGIIKEIEKGK